MNRLSAEEITKGMIELEGWEWNAWRAFVICNEFRNSYKHLSGAKWVQLAHEFYGLIFRCKKTDIGAHPRYIEMSVHLEESKICEDHPFSARVAHRAIMLENQWLLDDFEVFKDNFKWLGSSLLGVSPQTNNKVKVKSDRNGDVIVPQFITERYVNDDGTPLRFYDKETKNYVDGFPLIIRPWYAKAEKSRVPENGLKKIVENDV